MYNRTLQSLFSYQIFFAVGVVILAVHPVIWLITTWIDPAYGSHGWLVFAVAALLFVLSLFIYTLEPRYLGTNDTVPNVLLPKLFGSRIEP